MFLRLITCMLIFLCLCSPSLPAGENRETTPSNPAPRQPKNIIFMIGDGMGLSQVTAGMIANNNYLELERCKHIGLVKTSSGTGWITDSAAGATAFSTGKKTFNGAVGVDMEGYPQKTILEIAEEKGLATGLVATVSITHATPAAFVAHQPFRTMHEEIALDMMAVPVDIFIGGGRRFFSHRSDGKNLIDTLNKNGYRIFDAIADVPDTVPHNVGVFLGDLHLPSLMNGRDTLLLANSVQLAIDKLKTSEKGFFLVVEGSQIDWGGHQNNSEYIIREMLDFDRAIKVALDFAEADGETLIVITADHETGGYAINYAMPEKGRIYGVFTTVDHTAAMVPSFAFGPGAENFTGIFENTAIFTKFLQIVGYNN